MRSDGVLENLLTGGTWRINEKHTRCGFAFSRARQPHAAASASFSLIVRFSSEQEEEEVAWPMTNKPKPKFVHIVASRARLKKWTDKPTTCTSRLSNSAKKLRTSASSIAASLPKQSSRKSGKEKPLPFSQLRNGFGRMMCAGTIAGVICDPATGTHAIRTIYRSTA